VTADRARPSRHPSRPIPKQESEHNFYGDRVAMSDDPYGHRWNIGTHIEDVPPEAMGRRAAEVMSAP
jgi:hypothetical protein